MSDNSKGLVSIVLPIYNGEKYMRQSIDSVINQTYKNWELIIIDDCSSDNTPIIAKEYAKKDDRIRYYRNESNLKLPGGLNRGFSLSKGDYLTWTSDDNQYLPQAIEKMLFCMKEQKVDLVYAGSEIVDEQGQHVSFFKAESDTKRAIFGWNCVGACFLYTREVYDKIGKYDENLFLVEDYDYWLRVCSCFNAFGIDEMLYVYRTHSQNLTNTARKGEIAELCEKMLLKNVSLYGKIDKKQKFRLYTQLHSLRANLDNPKDRNKYKVKWMFYKFINLFGFEDKIENR